MKHLKYIIPRTELIPAENESMICDSGNGVDDDWTDYENGGNFDW